MKHIEDKHQEALFTWAKLVRVRLVCGEVVRLFDFLYAVPNGGRRNSREAARLKAQGVKAGVSDVHLVLPTSFYHGLWIELKRPIVKGKEKPRVSSSQTKWLNSVEKVGHKGIVAFGVDEAKAAIKEYLGQMIVRG